MKKDYFFLKRAHKSSLGLITRVIGFEKCMKCHLIILVQDLKRASSFSKNWTQELHIYPALKVDVN